MLQQTHYPIYYPGQCIRQDVAATDMGGSSSKAPPVADQTTNQRQSNNNKVIDQSTGAAWLQLNWASFGGGISTFFVIMVLLICLYYCWRQNKRSRVARVTYSRPAETADIEIQPESILRTPRSTRRSVGSGMSRSASLRSVHEPIPAAPRTGVQVLLDEFEAEQNQATQF